MNGYDNVVGQVQIKDFIKKSVCRNKISHAYIFNGEKGGGRNKLARLFAATLQCTGEYDEWNIESFSKPCGKCRSCLQMESGNQPDVITVTHEKSTIGVDDIRDQVNNSVGIKPYAGPYKIYIIPEADKMTEQAQNALLKTIEEPPEYAVIMLIVESIGSLLPTILSRCVQLNMKPLSETEIVDYLMKNCKIPDYMAQASALFSQGNIGKAIRYATDEDFIEIKDIVIKSLKVLDNKRVDELLDIVRQFKDEGYNIEDYLDIVMLWYRDILLYKAVKDPSMVMFKEEARAIDRQARVRSYEDIESCLKAVDKAKQRLNANVNFDITMELLLITLKEIS